MRYIDPDGRELWGWMKGIQCGWNDCAPQTSAGYHNWMDTASIALFNIDHAEINMGGYTIRFWKGDYGSTCRAIASFNPQTSKLSLFVGMAGGETGLYKNDGKGLGSDEGGSLMSPSDLDNLGITNVSLSVRNQNGDLIASVDGKRAWPNVYNLADQSKKSDLYTQTTFSFKTKEQASSFFKQFNDKLNSSNYEKQFTVQQNEKNVTITWGER